MDQPDITIIGLGGLGTTLTKSLIHQDFSVKSVFNRSKEKATRISFDYDIQISGAFPEDKNQLGRLIFITVADRAIKEIADRLAELSSYFSEFTIVHCSGTESADLLKSLKEKGAKIASLHPLQTFSAQSGLEDFNDIFFSIEGDEEAFPILQNVAGKIGAKTFTVSAEQKSHLHAAAVVACNYLITLLDTSTEIGTISGLTIEQVKQALFPLIKTTLKNAESESYSGVLTGPIKRGDYQTVQKHLNMLKDYPELLHLYSELGTATLKLADSSGDLTRTDARKLRTILEE
jgi:predicted short-subunit dehydrogenase-like oxidoreductase (DUF2520 family)